MLLQFITMLSSYIRHNMQIVCFGMTVVTLMIAGPTINGLFKNAIKNMHGFLQYLFYIILCTVGYGFLSQVIYHGVRNWLRGQSNMLLVIWTAAIYLVLAWFAKQQKDI